MKIGYKVREVISVQKRKTELLSIKSHVFASDLNVIRLFLPPKQLCFRTSFLCNKKTVGNDSF